MIFEFDRCTKNGTMVKMKKAKGRPLRVVFYMSSAGKEPLREWLKTLPRKERKVIGEDVKTVQFGWPMGMPLIRKLGANLWEVRSKLGSRVGRVLFTEYKGVLVLLHGFIKKSQKTPVSDLNLAKKRLKDVRGVK